MAMMVVGATSGHDGGGWRQVAMMVVGGDKWP